MRMQRRRGAAAELPDWGALARSTWARAAAIGLATFILGYTVAASWLFPAAEDPTDTRLISVPDLVGETEEEATRRARDDEFEPRIQARISDPEASPGTVIAQRPLPGQQGRPGTEITLVLSAGAETAIVPDVLGLSANEAASVLRELGFEVEIRREGTRAGSPGVREIGPEPGTRVVMPGAVTIVVNEGAELVSVPDVRGSHVDDVEARLVSEGLQLGAVRYRSDTPDAPGRVISQSPPPTSSVRSGAFVSIEVAGQDPNPAPASSDSTGTGD